MKRLFSSIGLVAILLLGLAVMPKEGKALGPARSIFTAGHMAGRLVSPYLFPKPIPVPRELPIPVPPGLGSPPLGSIDIEEKSLLCLPRLTRRRISAKDILENPQAWAPSADAEESALKKQRKTAEECRAKKQYELGRRYEFGNIYKSVDSIVVPFPQDNVRALAWYIVAAGQNEARVKASKKHLARFMSREEVDTAINLAREYLGSVAEKGGMTR